MFFLPDLSELCPFGNHTVVLILKHCSFQRTPWCTTTRSLAAPLRPCTAAQAPVTPCRGWSGNLTTTHVLCTREALPTRSARGTALSKTKVDQGRVTTRTRRSTVTATMARQSTPCIPGLGTTWRSTPLVLVRTRPSAPVPPRGPALPHTASAADTGDEERTTYQVDVKNIVCNYELRRRSSKQKETKPMQRNQELGQLGCKGHSNPALVSRKIEHDYFNSKHQIQISKLVFPSKPNRNTSEVTHVDISSNFKCFPMLMQAAPVYCWNSEVWSACIDNWGKKKTNKFSKSDNVHRERLHTYFTCFFFCVCVCVCFFFVCFVLFFFCFVLQQCMVLRTKNSVLALLCFLTQLVLNHALYFFVCMLETIFSWRN